MEELLLPSKIQLSSGENERMAVLSVEPCYHGYGTTLGNALRRVLLSSLPGAAVVAVKIKSAQHEFSSVDGVKEDVLELILNLKQLRLRIFAESDEPIRLHLSVKGEKKVTAADIEKNADVEIANPDLHLATLTDKKSDLEMEIFVSKGRGYVPIEERAKDKHELGVIAVDALYSPIREVGFRVENVRVGQITNYDKLVMNIETDGTITPADALQRSVKILADHFALLTGDLSSGEASSMSMPSMPAAEEEAVSVEAEEASDEAEGEDKPKKAKKKK